MEKDIDEDRLSILEKIERGEISIEEAEVMLRQLSGETKFGIAQEERIEQVSVEDGTANIQGKRKEERKFPDIGLAETDVPTRRERKLALTEKFQNWEPRMMMGVVEAEKSPWQWPWENKSWQWMWQNFDYPICVSHIADVSEGSELQIVSYQGDIFIRGWDEPTLKINGASFDLRMGQGENVTRIASSTGQLQIWVPKGVARVEAVAKPGDIWISRLSADVDAYCQGGDLSCQYIKGNIEARVNGGDARLMEIEGDIYVNSIRGNSKVRDILSRDVTLKATEGDICLSLDAVSKGSFRCENDKGDINLLTKGELTCELLMEATKGGSIAPVILPWQTLMERSEGKIHGILKGGGAYISLVTQSGRIYIQESWMNTFPVTSSS